MLVGQAPGAQDAGLVVPRRFLLCYNLRNARNDLASTTYCLSYPMLHKLNDSKNVATLPSSNVFVCYNLVETIE